MVANPKQDEVINNINGIYVVDAGAGTGKTYTITKRYLNILSQKNITPNDILLLTFTKNAAENMKEKIVNKLIETSPEVNALEANIMTFHSFCKQILSYGCEDVTSYLGLSEKLTRNFNMVENEIMENVFFRHVYNSFKKEHTEYDTEYKIIKYRYLEVLSLIKKLLSEGIFPTKDGWFLDGESRLKGDSHLFDTLVSELNVAGVGSRGPTQSKFLNRFKPKVKGKFFLELPLDYEVDKCVNPVLIKDAFDDDRTQWMQFIHDIYFSYITYSLKENRLTFDFLIMFAYLELYHNKKARDENSFEYVMIDEFQDTNEMQFMLSLLLMKTNNLCVVGDWKQGIYSFRNATIENITEFKDKIAHYKKLLNHDETRISFSVDSEEKDFELNFRSSQKILDFSVQSLYIKGSKDEEIYRDTLDSKIIKLKSNFDLDDVSDIKLFLTEDKDSEIKFILSKISEMVGNDKYQIKEYDLENNFSLRPVTYKDFAILSRTRTFGLNVHEIGMQYGIPVNYDGGIELFKTKEVILLLAILRIFTNKNDQKGWITILDNYNYSIGDKKKIIDTKSYPTEILELRKSLFKYKKNITYLVTKIFKYFDIDNNYSNAVIKEFGQLFSNNLISIEHLIYFIEENIRQKKTYNIEINTCDDAVTIQTIHGSKGLEYPIVFVANCNSKQFPSTLSDKDIITTDNLFGLRCSKLYDIKNGYHAIFDNYKTDVVKCAKINDYDEERRLFFVAITRAKQYVFITAHNPSEFFRELVEIKEVEIINDFELKHQQISYGVDEVIISVPEYETKGNTYSAHDLMHYTHDDAVKGKGKEYGTLIHHFGEQLALGKKVSEDENKYPELILLKKFISSIPSDCEMITEIECALPLGTSLVRGIIDLLVIYEDKIEIVDYKTDMSKLNHGEYVKQMSVYYHVVSEYYKKPVVCKIFYISLDEMVSVSPLGKDKLYSLID